MICSPVLAVEHCTNGSDFDSRFKPSTNFGRSCAFLGSTATRTTAATVNFMVLNGWAVSLVTMVPVLSKYWSTPMRPTKFPAGQSEICSVYRPIMSRVRWIFLMYRSFFLPNSKSGPMIRTVWPVFTVPANTRAKAINRPFSEVGTIFDTYMARSEFWLQFRMSFAVASSMGPEYKFSTRYFWAVEGDGRWSTIIENRASPAGIHF